MLSQREICGRSVIEGKSWDYGDLTGYSFKGKRLVDCSFRYAYLLGADFTYAYLYGCSLEGADLRRADLRNSTISRCEMPSSVLGGTYIRDAALLKNHLPPAIDVFLGCCWAWDRMPERTLVDVSAWMQKLHAEIPGHQFEVRSIPLWHAAQERARDHEPRPLQEVLHDLLRYTCRCLA